MVTEPSSMLFPSVTKKGNSDVIFIPRFRDERAKPTIPIHPKEQGLYARRLGLEV
jgi:hypothetical protein